MIENSARHENIYIIQMYDLIEGRNAMCLWHCCQTGRDIRKKREEDKVFNSTKEGDIFIY